MLTKTWIGTTADAAVVTNWQKVPLRTPAFRWQPSIAGTDVYYLQTSAGANPNIVASPPSSGGLYLNGVAATKGASVAGLTAGQWFYDDVDTLGYSTIYVRLTDGADPDTKATGWVQMNQVPQAGEHVFVPEGSGAMTGNVDFSGLALGNWTVGKSNDNRAHGAELLPIRLNVAGFLYEGGGSTPAYYDLTNSAISPEIRSTPSVDVDEFGLYLAGTAATLADIKGGSVGLGVLPGQPFTATTGVRVRGSTARVSIGPASSCPLLEVTQGNAEHECSIADIDVHGGALRTKGAAACSGVVTVNGGSWSEESSGTKARVTQNGGSIDVTQDGSPLTWTQYQHNAGTFRDDTDRLTIGTQVRAEFPGVCTRARI